MPPPDFKYQAFPADPDTPSVAFSFRAVGRISYPTDKILPTGLVVAIVTFGAPHRLGKNQDPARNPSFSDAWIQGNWTMPLYHTPTDGTDVIGLAVPPQALMRLTGRPTSDLTDRVVSARDVLPGPLMETMLSMAANPDDPAAHRQLHTEVQAACVHHLPPWVDKIANDIATARGQVDLSALYAGLPVSERTARASFKAAVGITPRQAARIARLLALLEQVDPANNVDWTSLAHDHSFFDQAHFNNEFRKITGLYPSKYLDDRRKAYPDAQAGEHVSFAPE